MKKNNLIILLLAALLTGCTTQYTRVLKSDDNIYKYEYAKESFATGKFQHAVVLLEELVTLQKGRGNAQESLYMLAMAQYCNRDYDAASATFRKFYQSYPRVNTLNRPLSTLVSHSSRACPTRVSTSRQQ